MNELRQLQGKELPAYRKAPLPTGPLQGEFYVTEPVLRATKEALVETALDGIHQGGHEEMVLWAGKEKEDAVFFLPTVLPETSHSRHGVEIDEQAVGHANQAIRPYGIGVLAQVHSHPGSGTVHSDGDDDLILMPFQGMLSIVAPRFGIDMDGLETLSIHQYQDGEWVLCTTDSIEESFTVVPEEIDAR